MKPRVALAAAALLALAGSIGPMESRLSAAEGGVAPAAANAPAQDSDLPRFEPAPEEFAASFDAFDDVSAPITGPVTGAVSIPVVQPIPEAADDEADRPIGTGIASWYGREFAGRKTANGERFNPGEMTAAHRTLPFGSKVRVTRGGKSVIVRINDRGPFHGNRVIDLSHAAAAELGLVRAGSGRVELALLGE